MALARLCLNRALAGCLAARPAYAAAPAAAGSRTGQNFHSLFSTDAAATGAPSGGDAGRREVAVKDRDDSSGAGAAARRGGRWAWRDLREFTPFRLVDGLGSALSQAAAALGRPLERLAPSRLLSPAGKVREDEARYRLRFEVPGLGKDDVRVAVEDGVLVIDGEKREHGGGGEEEEEWWAASGYHASLVLPDDARPEGITAEVRDGVLYVTVPRTGERRRNVTEIKVQ
ncbi:hypothetical protein ACP4OV_009329 [Aristida adscensionis]